MCRLFPSELIDAIASAKPSVPGVVDAVARHIRDDLIRAGNTCRMTASGPGGSIHAFAQVAVAGSPG